MVLYGRHIRSRRGFRKKATARKTLVRAKFQKKSARVNRSLIVQNARVINRLSRAYRKHVTTCDWRVVANLDMFTTAAENPFAYVRLTDLPAWQSVLRGNPAGDQENSTYIAGMNLRMRCDLLYSQPGAYIEVYLVSPQKWYADFDPAATPIIGTNRLYMSSQPYMHGVFNPEAVKVHKRWVQSLTPGCLDGSVPVNGPYTPNTIFDRRHYKRLGWKVQSPLNRSWKEVTFADMPYQRQLWLIARVVTAPADNVYVMGIEAHFTTKQYD